MLKLNLIEDIIARHKWESPEDERKALLEKAKNLDRSRFAGELSKEDYDAERKKTQVRLRAIDVEISFWKSSQLSQGMLREKGKENPLTQARKLRADALLQKLQASKSDVYEAKRLFGQGKISGAELIDFLREKNSEAHDVQEEIQGLFYRQAMDRAKQENIMLDTKKRLEETKGETMAKDIVIQLPEKDRVEFQKMPKRLPSERERRRERRHHRVDASGT